MKHCQCIKCINQCHSSRAPADVPAEFSARQRPRLSCHGKVAQTRHRSVTSWPGPQRSAFELLVSGRLIKVWVSVGCAWRFLGHGRAKPWGGGNKPGAHGAGEAVGGGRSPRVNRTRVNRSPRDPKQAVGKADPMVDDY